MSLRKVTTPKVPEPAGNIYSQCLVLGDQIFLAGQTAGGADGKPVAGASMEAQARTVFERIRHLLEAADSSMADIVKMTTYVTDISKRPELAKVRAEVFTGNIKPCSTLLEVKGLASPDLMIEVDIVAIRGARRT